MKSASLFRAAMVSIAAIAAATGVAHAGKKVQYEVTHLEAAGTSHRGAAINARGWVAGFATRIGGEVRHAALWKGGDAVDIGAIGGFNANSSVVWRGLNNRGMVVGISQTAQADPLGEEWSCSAFFPAATAVGPSCLGFVWERGELTPLPAFPGGNNSFATGVNDSGQIVGWAENEVRDETCNTPQILQFRAALWEPLPHDVRMKELTPLPGDATSAATAINERGNAVGISGDCDVAVGRFSARHSVLWRDGEPVRIADFGGVSWNTPMAINIKDEVVGFANPPGDEDGEYNATAFYWNEEEGVTNLRTLPGDTNSQAHGVNTQGEVVGISFGGSAGSRAFIWRKGDPEMTDLNTCVVSGYTGVLLDARDINDRGEITGSARDANGTTVTFVARPVHNGDEGC